MAVDDEEALRQIMAALDGADPDKLREIVRGHRELAEIKRNLGPQTKEELWDFFKEKYKIELGTVAVCPGHVAQLDLVWEVYNFLSVLWVLSRGYGKCVVEGTMVYDPAAGVRRPVQELCDGDTFYVLAMYDDGSLQPALAFGEPQGTKTCVRLNTDSNRSISLSTDHPVLTTTGWVKAGDLHVGDRLVVPDLDDYGDPIDTLCGDVLTDLVGIGDRETYDVCVPGFGNFVADDIIVHNTSLMALVDDAQATFYPGWSSFTIGPGRDQGERKYEHLLPYVIDGGVIGGKELPHVERSTTTKTEYKNGSKIEISLGGDPANANGPRAPRLHRDEIELMLDATRKQAVNIPAGKKTRDGRYVPAQTVDTSTMKWAGGYVHQQLEEYLETLKAADVDPTQMDPIDAYYLAIDRGHRPKKAVRVSCLFEVAEENPSCRSVPDDQRRARLVELDRDPDELCPCDTYVSDVWDASDDPDESVFSDEVVASVQRTTPRTLEDVCQGRFFRSRGHKDFTDILMLFLENDRATWEAEQECSEPSREGAYLKAYSQDRHGVRGYRPDPENGPIFSTTDWGGTDLYHHAWWQELVRPVRVSAYKGEGTKLLPVGTRVAFGEISVASIGNVELGKMVQARELDWIMMFPGWMVEERYYDNASPAAKMDWVAQLGMQGMVSRIRKDFIEELKMVRTEVGGARIMVDITACPVLDKGMRSWRQVKGREVRNDATHPLAGTRYYLHNRRVVERELARAGSRQESRPAAADDHDERPRERADELERGVKIIRHHVPSRSLVGAAGAEDSPLRSRSGSIDRPDTRSTERIDR